MWNLTSEIFFQYQSFLIRGCQVTGHMEGLDQGWQQVYNQQDIRKEKSYRSEKLPLLMICKLKKQSQKIYFAIQNENNNALGLLTEIYMTPPYSSKDIKIFNTFI